VLPAPGTGVIVLGRSVASGRRPPEARDRTLFSSFSSDGSTTIQFAIIFLVIFAVLAITVFVIRRLPGRGQPLSAKGGGRGRQPRLGIVDIYELDRQRQLILLRRDNVEHLLLVGGPNDVVVERNITRGAGARLGEDEAVRPEAEPAVLDAARFQPAFEAALAMPVAVPPPLPDAAPRPDTVGRPLDLPAPDLFVPDETGPTTVRPPDPRPAFETPAEPPAPPVAVPASRPPRRMPPSLTNLVPGAASLMPGLAKRGRSDDAAPAPADAEGPPQGASSPVDPDILSDMARQLEQAVRRPQASATPARPVLPESATEKTDQPAAAHVVPERPGTSIDPVVTAPVAAHAPPVAADAVDPMAAAMAATAEAPERDDALFDPAPEPERPTPVMDRPNPAMVRPTPSSDGTAPLPVAPESPTASSSVPTEPEPPVPAAAPVKPAAERAPPPADIAKPAATPGVAAANPFSVEEIEAEFARLLGRSLDKKG